MWNNPIRYNDPDGRCPECEEEVKNPSEGQVYESRGGAEYTFGNGQWTRDGGMLNGVNVEASRLENNALDQVDFALTTAGGFTEYLKDWQQVRVYGLAKTKSIIRSSGAETSILEAELEP
jgi:hypothetical protein